MSRREAIEENLREQPLKRQYEAPKVKAVTEEEILATFQVTQAMASWWASPVSPSAKAWRRRPTISPAKWRPSPARPKSQDGLILGPPHRAKFFDDARRRGSVRAGVCMWARHRGSARCA